MSESEKDLIEYARGMMRDFLKTNPEMCVPCSMALFNKQKDAYEQQVISRTSERRDRMFSMWFVSMAIVFSAPAVFVLVSSAWLTK